MWTKGQIAFVVIDVILGIVGWALFIVFYDDWQTNQYGDEEGGWWAATIGLYVGIACSALLVIFALVKGAIDARAAARKRAAKLQQVSFVAPNLAPAFTNPSANPYMYPVRPPVAQ